MNRNELTTHQVDAALAILTRNIGSPELLAAAETYLVALFVQIPDAESKADESNIKAEK